MILISSQLEASEWVTNLLLPSSGRRSNSPPTRSTPVNMWTPAEQEGTPCRYAGHLAMAPPRHQLQNLIGDFPAFRDMVMGSVLACLMMNFEISFFFSTICIPARRNIFNWNSCLVLLLMRFPASWKLLIVLPAFGFCFDYLSTVKVRKFIQEYAAVCLTAGL